MGHRAESRRGARSASGSARRPGSVARSCPHRRARSAVRTQSARTGTTVTRRPALPEPHHPMTHCVDLPQPRSRQFVAAQERHQTRTTARVQQSPGNGQTDPRSSKHPSQSAAWPTRHRPHEPDLLARAQRQNPTPAPQRSAPPPLRQTTVARTQPATPKAATPSTPCKLRTRQPGIRPMPPHLRTQIAQPIHSQRSTPSRAPRNCGIEPYPIKAAPLRCAAARSAPRSGLGAPLARARQLSCGTICLRGVFLALDCPAPGRHV